MQKIYLFLVFTNDSLFFFLSTETYVSALYDLDQKRHCFLKFTRLYYFKSKEGKE
jgi:hypothetical protein